MSTTDDQPEEKPAAANGEEEEEDEEDLEALQKEIARMEAEAARISKETEDIQNDTTTETDKDKTTQPNDGHSIYVGQVDYSTTPEELLQHFDSCGSVERITIVCDKYTGRPKGFAYLEFQDEAAVQNALKLDNSEFKGRNLKITPKRVNEPGMSSRGGGRGGFRGGRGRGGFRGGRGGRGGFRGRGRGGYRGRGGGGYHHPYY